MPALVAGKSSSIARDAHNLCRGKARRDSTSVARRSRTKHSKSPLSPPDLEVGAERFEQQADDIAHEDQCSAFRFGCPSGAARFGNACAGWRQHGEILAPARRRQLPVAALRPPSFAPAYAAVMRAAPALLERFPRSADRTAGEQGEGRQHQTREELSNHGVLLGAERPILPGEQGPKSSSTGAARPIGAPATSAGNQLRSRCARRHCQGRPQIAHPSIPSPEPLRKKPPRSLAPISSSTTPQVIMTPRLTRCALVLGCERAMSRYSSESRGTGSS